MHNFLKKQYFRYLLSGVFFTLSGPLLFIFISTIISMEKAMIINEMIIHILRYKFFKYYVFTNLSTNIFSYIISILPITTFNVTIAFLFKDGWSSYQIATLSIIYSTTIGYILTKYIFNIKK
tara:strand:- start:9 stop:374 length:366 start_codon:yes stop_codon:yes gene_type:complete